MNNFPIAIIVTLIKVQRCKFQFSFIKNMLLFLIFHAIFISNISSQDNQSIYRIIDSLRTEYIHGENDSINLSRFTSMARYYRYVDVDSSKILLREAISQYKIKKINREGQAFAYNVIADIYRLEQNVDSTRYYYEEAFDLFQNLVNPDPLLAIAPAYGNFLVKNGEAEKGIEVLRKAIQVAIENDDNHSLSFLYASLGNIIANVQDDHLTAKSIFEKGLESSKNIDEVNFKRVNATINLGLATIFFDEKKIDSTIAHAELALKMSEEIAFYQKALISCNTLSHCYLTLGDLEKANFYNENAINLISEIRSVESIIDTKVIKVAIFRKSNSLNRAISYGNRVLEEHSDQLNDLQKEELFNYLFDCHTLIGDKTNSIRLKDSLLQYTHHNYDSEHGKLLAKMYDETLVMEQKAKNKLLVLQQEESKKRLTLQSTIGFFLLLTLLFALAWGVSTYRLFKQKNELSQNLEKLVIERTEDLQILNDNLTQANEELRALTYIASHDIKEPLMNIGAFAGLIERRLPKGLKDSFQKEFLFISKKTKQLYTLIEDMTKYINFSKSEVINIEEVNLESIIEKVKSDLSLNMEYEDHQILHSDLVPFTSNYSAIYFIMKNLIENGLKYNENAQPTVKVFQKETHTENQIFVKDNGLGIAEQYHERIFEMHKRLHNRDKYEGTGLGLSIAKILVKKLDGRIEVESKLSQGSTFILYLPKIKYDGRDVSKQISSE